MHHNHIYPMREETLKEIRKETDIESWVRSSSKRIRAKILETENNIRTQSENKGPDVWHVLVDHRDHKKIKQSAMSRHEAWRRNQTIKDIGMEWTLGEM